eukprot:scaffold206252_cov81-Attheya_sp.AAC.1
MIISLLSRSTNSGTAPHCRPIAAPSLGYETVVWLEGALGAALEGALGSALECAQCAQLSRVSR